MTTSRPVRTITEAAVLKALAHPTRTRLLDVLRVHGPGTASSLAEATGIAVGSASHHVRVLAEAGLVEEAPELARDGRERWWRSAGKRLRWSSDELEPSARLAGQAAADLLFSQQIERTRRWLAEDRSEVGFATQSWLWLDADEMAELEQGVTALLERFADRDHAGRQPVLCYAKAFPSEP